MLKTINTVGKFIKIAIKYYAVIMVVAKAWEMVSTEIKKVHSEIDGDVSEN